MSQQAFGHRATAVATVALAALLLSGCIMMPLMVQPMDTVWK